MNANVLNHTLIYRHQAKKIYPKELVINSGLLCLLSGMNHYKSFGGTWRRLLTLRDEIIRDSYLSKYLPKVILLYNYTIKRNFEEITCSVTV